MKTDSVWEKGIWPTIIVMIAVFATYANVYGNAFLYDDTHLIVGNAFLRDWHDWPKLFSTFLGAGDNISTPYYRPLQSLAYMAVFQIAGLSTVAFHFLNVALHAANACLLMRLGRGLGFDPKAALLGALLWAVHPVNVEAVTYMSATADTLYSFFCLAGLVVLLPDLSPRRIVAACPFFVAGLLSKESAIAFPLLAATIIYLKDDRRFDPRFYIRLWPLAALALMYVGLHVAFASVPHLSAAGTVAAGSNNAASPFAVLPFYARLVLWPTNLFMEHDLLLSGLAAAACTVAGFAMVVASGLFIANPQSRASVAAGWGLLWFFCAYLPSGFTTGIVYEHWLYLPLAGLFLGVAQCLSTRKDSYASRTPDQVRGRLLGAGFPRGGGDDGFALPVGAVVLAATLSCLTWQQNTLWHDPVRFYTTIIERSGPAPKAHANLALVYALNQRYAEALAQFDLAFAGYARLPDRINEAIAQNDAAMTLAEMPDHAARQDDIMAHLIRAVQLDPDNDLALRNLADFYARQGGNGHAEP